MFPNKQNLKPSLEDITDYNIHQEISHLMEIKVKPKGFSSFKKFKQHRDARVKELMFKLRSFFFPSGKIIKRSNGKTYKVMNDGSFIRFDPQGFNTSKVMADGSIVPVVSIPDGVLPRYPMTSLEIIFCAFWLVMIAVGAGYGLHAFFEDFQSPDGQ